MDVRALLRQQRAARRIEHPHAAYSDAGKLICVVCHEHIKTESLWDGHARSTAHEQRLEALQKKRSGAESDGRNGIGAQSNKRKLDEDEEMADDTADEEAVRKKRSRPDMTLADTSIKDDGKAAGSDDIKPLTPPLRRQSSGTPTLGVEMQIPSRPATPVATREGGASLSNGSGVPSATTPKATPVGRSPLIPQDATAAQLPQTGFAAKQTPAIDRSAPLDAPIDEVWAAFEADLVHGTSAKSTKPAAVAGFADTDAVISAPAMTAAEIAAKSEEEEQAKRHALVDTEIEDEREEATRALEVEFEVMEELEARVRKLRERREALRLQSGSGEGGSSASAPAATSGLKATNATIGKENAAAGATAEDEDDEDEDDDDDEDDDMEFRSVNRWVGFRL